MQIVKASDKAIRVIEEQTIKTKEKITEYNISDLKKNREAILINKESIQKQLDDIDFLIKTCGDLGVTDEGSNIKI